MIDDISVLPFEKPVVELERKIEALKVSALNSQVDITPEIIALTKQCEKLKTDIFSSLTTWQKVQLARHPKRPYMMDYVNHIFTDFTEFHGDRAYADDRALICGFAMFNGAPCAVIGHQKGRNLQENMERNFGMAHPEGYRKALRIMKLAEKFNKPIFTFIDTSGAYCGIGAEERGQGEAIARNLREMADLKVPVISIVIGEGGSGGALGIGVANRVLMLENAYYSVISPEGCAAILFRDASRAADAAEAMKITPESLIKFSAIDEIIQEPMGGAHRDLALTASNIKKAFTKHLESLNKLSPMELFEDRYNRFRKLGSFKEETVPEKTEKKKTKKTKNTRNV